MKIILAQGNPGSQYDSTRHNVGFAAVDAFVAAQQGTWTTKSKFHALISELTVGGQKVIVAKPTTFYNETGVSARKLTDFYSADPTTDLLVIHDELALPFGTVRTRAQGGDAGNNGIKSINSHVGPAYHRIRIGIANDLRDRMDDADFVLAAFSADEKQAIKDTVLPHATQCIHQFLADELAFTTHTL